MIGQPLVDSFKLWQSKIRFLIGQRLTPLIGGDDYKKKQENCRLRDVQNNNVNNINHHLDHTDYETTVLLLEYALRELRLYSCQGSKYWAQPSKEHIKQKITILILIIKYLILF